MTVRELSAITPPVVFGVSVYVIALVEFVFLGMLMTTSWSTFVSATAPRDVAPGGAAKVAVTVIPAGIGVERRAVILCGRLGLGVVTVYVVVLLATGAG